MPFKLTKKKFEFVSLPLTVMDKCQKYDSRFAGSRASYNRHKHALLC